MEPELVTGGGIVNPVNLLKGRERLLSYKEKKVSWEVIPPLIAE